MVQKKSTFELGWLSIDTDFLKSSIEELVFWVSKVRRASMWGSLKVLGMLMKSPTSELAFTDRKL